MTIHLNFNQLTAAEKEWFATPEAIYALTKEAQYIKGGMYSRIWRWQLPSGEAYYIKIYHLRGRYLRAYYNRSRARGEWENLRYFEQKGLLIPDLLVYGESTQRRHYENGFLVQREVTHSRDLRDFSQEDVRWQDVAWRRQFLSYVMSYLRKLHSHQFIHRDFRWRNILIKLNDPMTLYFIDCPLGRQHCKLKYKLSWWRDLRDFDKDARHYLSRSDRLRLYLAYRQRTRLTPYDKRIITKIYGAHIK